MISPGYTFSIFKALPFNIVTIIAYFNGYFFTLKKGYTPETSVCVNRQFWHFAIIISLIVNLIFYLQVSRITKDVLV